MKNNNYTLSNVNLKALSEYPNYTPSLAKILEGLLSRSESGDKLSHHEEIIDAANEVVGSVDVDELARFLLHKSEPEDEEAENLKKKMEMTRDQLAEALYQKGLAMARIESLKLVRPHPCLALIKSILKEGMKNTLLMPSLPKH